MDTKKIRTIVYDNFDQIEEIFQSTIACDILHHNITPNDIKNLKEHSKDLISDIIDIWTQTCKNHIFNGPEANNQIEHNTNQS